MPKQKKSFHWSKPIAVDAETDFPIPRLLKRPPGPVLEILSTMKVGESFWLPRSSGANVYKQAARLHRKVMTRTMFKDGEKGIRIWRIK